MAPFAGYNRPADAPAPSYSVVGSDSGKAFSACLAMGTIAFAFGEWERADSRARASPRFWKRVDSCAHAAARMT